MPDTRGDVLCPTCGQWTPPAPFCTECGAALQVGLRESADQGSSVFRRGQEVDQPGSPWDSPTERFEPEPEDAAARGAAAGAAPAAGAGRIDNLSEAPPAPEPPWPQEPGMPGAPPPATPPPPPEAVDEPGPMGRTEAAAAAAAAAAVAAAAASADEAPAPPKRRSRAKATETPTEAVPAAAAAAGVAAATPEPAPPPPPPVEPAPPPPPVPPTVSYTGPPSDGEDGNSGVSGLVFVLFLGLGVLALLGGAILGGVFDGETGQASPTPSAAVSTPTPEPTPEASASASAAPSTPPSSAQPTPTPVPPADGFIARAEPCEEQPSGSTCDNSGAVNDGSVWILVSFRHAQPSDTIAVTVRDSGGAVADQGSIPLSFCGSNTDCAGYTYFQFGGFAPGDYDVEATRNGEPAATTEFTVE
ncbi:MAG TPA: hypothetical protein VIC63_07960 [Candidatus Limnocylindria bacterium]